MLKSLVIALVSLVSSLSASYYDGSLWIAGEEGVVRVGRNGRTIHYGDRELGVAKVVDILSDNAGNIWYLGSDGVVRSYSFVDGFAAFEALPGGVKTLSFNPSTGLVFASTNETLYSWDPSSDKSQNDSSNGQNQLTKTDLESPLVSMEFASDGTAWLLCENALYRLEKNGKLSRVSEAVNPGEVSKSIALKIETNKRRANWWAIIVALLIGITISDCVWRFRLIKLKSEPEKERSQGSAVQAAEPVPNPAPQQSSPKPQSQPQQESLELTPPDDFVSQVQRIIKDNISTQKFGVDEIAEITGFSRIHVNRKLKEAGCPSPSIMLKKARMELAGQLVKEGVLPMQEIALRCGFSSPSYFATSFRDYYGVPPTEFKA